MRVFDDKKNEKTIYMKTGLIFTVETLILRRIETLFVICY